MEYSIELSNTIISKRWMSKHITEVGMNWYSSFNLCIFYFAHLMLDFAHPTQVEKWEWTLRITLLFLQIWSVQWKSYITLNHSQVNTCFRMTHSRKYFVSGSDNGVVRIQEAPVPGQLLGNQDESRYWEVCFWCLKFESWLKYGPRSFESCSFILKL